ncbi:MAG: sugar transferase [Sphingomonadales bacterium]|nr:sugar transferase [Sphingomonadales bacterium]
MFSGALTDEERRLILSAPAPAVAVDSFHLRRLIDVVVSLSLIVLLAPVLLAIALLVVMTSPGNPIFAHKRVGQGGKTFPCLKFRSMHVDAEQRLKDLLASAPELREEWRRCHKLTNDPRVSRIGNLLRVTSFDELPQLFNVLAGQMTLVGPRPIVADELKHYGRFAGHYMTVKPGLTGLWQITGRSSVTYRRRVAADVLYIRSRSYLLDFRILVKTVPAILFRRGAW